MNVIGGSLILAATLLCAGLGALAAALTHSPVHLLVKWAVALGFVVGFIVLLSPELRRLQGVPRLVARPLGVLVLLLALAALLRLLHEVVGMLFLGGVVAFLIEPLVRRLQTRLPRSAAIALVYLLLIALVGSAIAFAIPHVANEARLLNQNAPQLAHRAQHIRNQAQGWIAALPESLRMPAQKAVDRLNAEGQALGKVVAAGLLSLLGWLARGVIILVISIYLLLDSHDLRRQIDRAIHPDYRDRVWLVTADLSQVLGSYLRGEALVIAFVSVAVTVLLLVLKVKFAFLIGITAGVLEVIPYFGALGGAIPGVALAFLRSPTTGVMALIGFVAINQLEGHVVIPLVMGHSVGLRPLSVLLALLAGHELFGVLGMVIAVPAVAILKVFIDHGVRLYRELKPKVEAQVAATVSVD